MADLFSGVVVDHVDGRAWVTLDSGWTVSATCPAPLPSRGSRASVQVELDGDGLPKSAQIVERENKGDAADRERYVTERANQLARAFIAAWPIGVETWSQDLQVMATGAFRDLIDKGVLK